MWQRKALHWSDSVLYTSQYVPFYYHFASNEENPFERVAHWLLTPRDSSIGDVKVVQSGNGEVSSLLECGPCVGLVSPVQHPLWLWARACGRPWRHCEV